MICKLCSKAAEWNRAIIDEGRTAKLHKHPKNCGCPCMHRNGAWEKLFSVGRPNA